MELENQLDSTRSDFVKYLNSLGISPKSHKNYRSDLSHFIGWLILRIRSFGSYIDTLTEATPFLSKNIAGEYKGYLVENQIPAKTINRRLSTLRHLSRFLIGIQIISSDFMEGIENISAKESTQKNLTPIIEEFRAYLTKEKVSPNTVKNYLSDIRQFLTWLEINHA